jgi:hypothetical protein
MTAMIEESSNQPAVHADAERASPAARRRNVADLLAAMIGTVVVLRAWLFVTPNADFTVRGVNVHHLYSGVLLTVLAAIPLALASSGGAIRRVQVACLGAGLGLMLDEWVYLIMTDGSNASYLLPISWWGAVVALGLASAYTMYCHARAARSDVHGRPEER